MPLRKKIIIVLVLFSLSFFTAIHFAIPELGGNFEEATDHQKSDASCVSMTGQCLSDFFPGS
jgi:hypothetical protein